MLGPAFVQRAVTSRGGRGRLDLQLKRLSACQELRTIMPLFKHPIPRFRRRPLRFFPDAPQSDGPLSIGDELDKLARSVSDPYARKVCLWHRPFPPVTTDGNTRNPQSSSYRKCNHFWPFTVDTLLTQRKRKLCMKYSATERLLIYSALYQGLEQGCTSRRTPDHRVRTTP